MPEQIDDAPETPSVRVSDHYNPHCAGRDDRRAHRRRGIANGDPR
jgi:hypothetical protein